jgi:antitoxin component of MazEF toxin-antitoxin module
LALKIKPVRLNKSIYVRIPNDIADLIGIDSGTDVTLRLQEAGEESFLIYAIRKASKSLPGQLPVVYADQKVATTTRSK